MGWVHAVAAGPLGPVRIKAWHHSLIKYDIGRQYSTEKTTIACQQTAYSVANFSLAQTLIPAACLRSFI